MSLERQPGQGGSRIGAPQDFAGGVFMVLFGAFAWWGASNLGSGTLRAMGPGMLPKTMAVIVAGIGVLMIVLSLRGRGPGLERWSLRGIVFVLGAIVVFGLVVRGFELPGGVRIPALGLLVGAPLIAVISAFGSEETQWGQLLVFAAAMTAFCVGLFKYALNLPIPLAPWLLGY